MNVSQIRAVVTGAASGLGQAVATHVIERGGSVTLLDLQAEAGARLAATLGKRAQFVGCDVSQESSVNAAMSAAATAMGGIDVLVNCAGVATSGRAVGKHGALPGEQFVRVLQINLVGTFLCNKAAAVIMQANTPTADGERGVIIQTASVAAFEGQIGQPAYAASKAGIVGMTLPLAREFASSGIRVLSIAPGIFMTPMLAAMSPELQSSLGQQVPFPQRLGRPEEFALLVESIVSNPMLNGETIRLDGAIRMQPR